MVRKGKGANLALMAGRDVRRSILGLASALGRRQAFLLVLAAAALHLVVVHVEGGGVVAIAVHVAGRDRGRVFLVEVGGSMGDGGPVEGVRRRRRRRWRWVLDEGTTGELAIMVEELLIGRGMAESVL